MYRILEYENSGGKIMELGVPYYISQDCDLLNHNSPTNDSDEQFAHCKLCYRFNICRNWYLTKKENLIKQLINERM